MLFYSLRPRWAAQAEQSGSRLARLLALRWRDTAEQHEKDRVRMRRIGVIGLVFSFCLAAGVGMLFAVLSSREFWHTGLFPITFLISALASGTALVVVAAVLLGRGGRAFRATLLQVARLVGFLLVVELIILPAETLVVYMGGIPADVAVLETIAFGPHAWVFWIVQLAIGTVIAMLLILGPRRASLALSATGALLTLLGTFAFRLNFVIPQQAHGLETYFPNMYEWNFVVFGAGLAGLLLTLGYRILPILPSHAPLEFELALRGPRPALTRDRVAHLPKGELHV
jgi:molybdopterin-containing oxidoreductase family membrane subunit